MIQYNPLIENRKNDGDKNEIYNSDIAIEGNEKKGIQKQKSSRPVTSRRATPQLQSKEGTKLR